MILDSRLSLGDLLLEHARQLSLQSLPHRQAVRTGVVRRKKHQTATRVRSSVRKAARDLTSVRNHLGEGEANIASQDDVVSRLDKSGHCGLEAKDDLALLHIEQDFRKAHLLKLLANHKDNV